MSGSSFDRETRHRPQLRLFSPGELAAADADAPAGLSPSMTLGDFFDVFVMPVWLVARRADAKTIGIYRQAVDLWKRFTGDPPLDQIDDFTTAEFTAGLFRLPGKGKDSTASPSTVHKKCRAVQTCLNLAGPKTPKRKQAQRLLEEVPWLEKPTIEEDDEGVTDNFELAEIAAILKACDTMTEPRRDNWTMRVRGKEIHVPGTGIDPPAFWRSLVMFAYNTGERKGAIFGVDLPPAGAEKIRFQAAVRKGKRKMRIVPLNAAAREAIEQIRTDRKQLFPWPHCPRHFYTVWHRLLVAAGIPEDRWFGLHGLRKATATEVSDYSPMGAQQIMGHSDGTLLQRHYVAQRLMRDALNRLPQPE